MKYVALLLVALSLEATAATKVADRPITLLTHQVNGCKCST
jgi:hypothetical protein